MKEDSGTLHFGPAGEDAYSHAYIVWGGSDDERSAFVRRLASAMVCQGRGEKPCLKCVHCEKAARGIHPDIITVDFIEQKREIIVDQVRALREDAFIMPNEAERKAYIINHAGSMNVSAQNALLKVLEEPPRSASFILAAETTAGLLPTVRSRCTSVSADMHMAQAEKNIDGIAADFIEALPDALKLTAFSFKLEKLDKDSFINFIEDAKTLLARKLKEGFQKEGAPGADYLINAVKVLNRAKEYFYYNVGLGHIAGMLCAELYIRNEEQHD